MGTTASNLFRGGAADGPAPKRLRRASELPAIQSVEDLFPPEMFFKVVAGGYLEPEEIGNVACANRQFKETAYNPRMTTGRGCIALIGQGCSPSVPEAKKWFKIAAELHRTREALIFLGEMASGGTTSLMKMFVRSRTEDAAEAENLFRAAVEADDSPSESYCIFAPAGHAHDLARIGLATMLMRKGGDDALVEAASLLDAVLDHDNIPSDQQQQMRRPNSEARALRAEIILQQQAPGALAEALELVEAIPAADLEGIEGSNCAYMLGKVYKTLDEETPNDEHARLAMEHIGNAVKGDNDRQLPEDHRESAGAADVRNHCGGVRAHHETARRKGGPRHAPRRKRPIQMVPMENGNTSIYLVSLMYRMRYITPAGSKYK